MTTITEVNQKKKVEDEAGEKKTKGKQRHQDNEDDKGGK